jgi:hypothetical protein
VPADPATGSGGGTLLEVDLAWQRSSRIIVSEFAGENLLDRITDDTKDADALRELADVTNTAIIGVVNAFGAMRPEDRYHGERPGLVMASFCFPASPSRFTDGTAGVLYVAQTEQTAIAETVYHQVQFLRASQSAPTDIEMTVLAIDFAATLVDLRSGCPCPQGIYHRTDYNVPQKFGAIMRACSAEGLVYDSVRDSGGECCVLFRPAVVQNCVAGHDLIYRWDGVQISVHPVN